MISIDATLLAAVVGSFIPLVTAIATKSTAPSGVKALVSAILAGATAVGMALTKAGGVIGWKEALIAFFVAFIAHVGAYHGLLKPTGVAPQLNAATDPIGIG